MIKPKVCVDKQKIYDMYILDPYATLAENNSKALILTKLRYRNKLRENKQDKLHNNSNSNNSNDNNKRSDNGSL